jgi:hypothetical protein
MSEQALGTTRATGARKRTMFFMGSPNGIVDGVQWPSFASSKLHPLQTDRDDITM